MSITPLRLAAYVEKDKDLIYCTCAEVNETYRDTCLAYYSVLPDWQRNSSCCCCWHLFNRQLLNAVQILADGELLNIRKKNRQTRRADNLTTFMCRLSWNLGASTSWNSLGLSRSVMGLLYLCFIYRAIKNSLCTWLLQYKYTQNYFKQFQSQW
jgi:hypothetical protein